MEKIVITEEQIKKVLDTILINEEVSKVSRQDFSRVQFKIEELQNSLNEAQKEFQKKLLWKKIKMKIVTSSSQTLQII